MSELDRRLERLGKVVSADRKQTRRERKLQKEMGEASVIGGSVMLLIALLLAVFGVLNPDKWWLLFVALGVGVGGARQIDLARRRDKGLATPEAVKKADRFEAACDLLLVELKDSPQAVREFLGKPEVTVEAIRAACRQLGQRQQQLLDTASAADLEQERKELEGRLGQLDPVTYKRATDALKLRTELFHQVRATADRLASEQQILLTSLESLRMRVALAKGAGGQGAPLGELKAEVDRLSDELTAITDALESVQLQPIAPIEAGSSTSSGQREKS